MKFAVILSYDGTEFCGWQSQSAESGPKPSVQDTLIGSLEALTGERVSVVGSGRTDAGVHAVGQVAHFHLERKPWTPEGLVKGLNARLPQSIRAIRAFEVAEDFHAQRSATKKQYSYYFQLGPVALPGWRSYSTWTWHELDVGAMHRAVQALLGEQDFKPFQARGAKPGLSTVRRIFEAEVTREPVPFPGVSGEFEIVRFRVVGSGFLKQMVRGLAGTLLEIGAGKRPASDLAAIIETQDRSAVGTTAPPQGLWLEQVWYEPSSGLNG